MFAFKELSKDARLNPDFSYWSPWIGEKSRMGDEVFNTEFRKCGIQTNDEMEDPMPEELLIHLLLDEKVIVQEQ